MVLVEIMMDIFHDILHIYLSMFFFQYGDVFHISPR